MTPIVLLFKSIFLSITSGTNLTKEAEGIHHESSIYTRRKYERERVCMYKWKRATRYQLVLIWWKALVVIPAVVIPARQCKTSSSPVMAEATSSRLAPHVQRAYQSAIARHLAENELCLSAYDDNAFTVLCRAKSKRHLEVLEAVYISTHAPQLCAQKQQVSPRKLFNKLTPTGSE